MGTAGWLLMAASAFSQTSPPPSNAQSTGSQPTAAQPVNTQPASQPPSKQSALDAAASASRLAHQTAPPTKVIRNHDLADGNTTPDTAKSGQKTDQVAAQPAEETQKDEQRAQQFERQGKIFKNQVKVEKGKIIDIQNHIVDLKNQFDGWSTGFAQDDEAQACWTSTYYTPYYKDWCDRGRVLKAQYDAAQKQLVEEKARLEQMQEDIRRKGYGNAVYDPD
jgi:hypothetical protein